MRKSICAFLLFLIGLALSDHDAHAGRMLIPGGGGEYTYKTETWLDRRYKGVIRQAYDYSCGSAALATLLSYYYDYPISEPEVIRQMYTHGDQEKIRREGFSLLDMKSYLGAIGLESAGYRESLDKLARVGIPAIVLINKRGYLHFVVVTGVTADKVLIADPALGRRVYSRAEFEPMWNGILFVISGRKDIARANFNSREAWGKTSLMGVNGMISDADLSRFTLSVIDSANYF